MTNVASSLLDFILGLFRDDEAARAFAEDPQQALAAAGLSDVSPAEVHDLMPMVSGYTPGGWHPAPHHDEHQEPDHHGHGHGGHCDDDDDDDHPVVGPVDHHDDHEPYHHAGPGPATSPATAPAADTTVLAHVQHIEVTNIQNTFTFVDVDASTNIWADGDAQVIFGGDGDDVIAGDDIENQHGQIGDTTVIKDNNVAIGNSGDVAQDGSAVDSGNTDLDSGPVLVETGPGSIVGGDQVGSENDGEGNTSIGGIGNAVGDGSEAGIDLENVGNEDNDLLDVDNQNNDQSFTDNSDNSDDDGLDIDNQNNDQSFTDNSDDDLLDVDNQNNDQSFTDNSDDDGLDLDNQFNDQSDDDLLDVDAQPVVVLDHAGA